MPRECNCAGGCSPQTDGVTRREFITLVGTGTAGALLGGPTWAEQVARQTPPLELARWKERLLKPSRPRRYRSDTHTDARMPLGGIGTGHFEIGVDGRFTTWQLFNTLRDGHVPFHFAVKAGPVAKLLQTTGGPDWPRVHAIEMQGEYPFATLRFADADLPVRLTLTAFSPFAPLDTRLSSLPVACFIFRVHNPTTKKQTVSLAAFMQNPVGYDAMGVPVSFNSVGFNAVEERLSTLHPNYGGNVNRVTREGRATVLLMENIGAEPPTLDTPVQLFTNLNPNSLNAPINDRPKNLTLHSLDSLSRTPSTQHPAPNTVIWLEDAPAELTPEILRAAREAVRKGATLIFAGREQPLLQSYGQITGGRPLDRTKLRPDIPFEDFENGYGDWKTEGTAFGERPATGTLPNQQRVTGFLGKGLVNTYLGGDDTMGRLVSKPFTIERNYIRFLVGGGGHASTQIRLVLDPPPSEGRAGRGTVVRTASGRFEERLLPHIWDVREFMGRQARIEIVDEQKGGWGHINVDQIELSDLPGSVAVMEILDELLPLRFSGLAPHPDPLHRNRNEVLITDPKPYEDTRATRIGAFAPFHGRAFGEGRVFICGGSLLPPERAEWIGARQQAYTTLCRLAGLRYTPPNGVLKTAPGYGALALATLGPKPTVIDAARDWQHAWETFANTGRFQTPDTVPPSSPSPEGRTVNGAIASTIDVPPGQTVEVPFFLAWRYPNKYNGAGVWMGNHYAEVWKDVRAVVREVAANFAALRDRTERFRAAVYNSSLPYWLLDCLTSQISTIRHAGVVFRIANGDTYGWEGSNGCCQPTCTHVWGYAQTLSRLFPDLEREMRRVDYKHQQRADGGINNRTEVPSPPRPTGEQPFADGHASCILKAYREALNAPDDGLLKAYWPPVRRAVEYLIARDAATSNGEPNGILEDDQWNTYDEALHGVTTFISGYYLAALRAGEEWARRLGDNATADRFRAIFEKGQKRLIELCWNGEYFQQHLPGYEKRPGEVGPGCMSDQMIGQWWAHQLGLGYLFPQEMVVSALKSIFKYNWMPDLTGWPHAPRAFAGAKDKGLIVCTWPKGGRPPQVMLYSDEVWTGIEYQVAAHCLYEGLLDEAFAIIKGARDRYDGVPRPPIPRNPWNEIECGGHYARAMSSWSLLLALSGFEYDGPAKRLRFTPRYRPHNFKAFFTGPEGWGSLRQTRRGKTQRDEIAVAEGRLVVERLSLHPPSTPNHVRVTVGGKAVAARLQSSSEGVTVLLTAPTTIRQGETLAVSFT